MKMIYEFDLTTYVNTTIRVRMPVESHVEAKIMSDKFLREPFYDWHIKAVKFGRVNEL